MRQEDKEISIVDLLLSLLEKWRLLVAVTLALTVLATSYGVIKSNKMKRMDIEAKMSMLEASLSEKDLSNIESAASIINEYKVMSDSQKEYIENSIYQKLNPFDIKTATLKYYVDNGYKVSYPIIEENNTLVPLVQTYIAVLNKDSIYEKMSKEINPAINPLYFSDMVLVKTEDTQEMGLFIITILADTNEHLEKMVAIVKDELSDSTDTITNIYGEHTLTLAYESTKSEENIDVYNQQQLNVQNLLATMKNITETERGFSGNQLLYLKGLVNEDITENVSVVKYAVLGAAAGFVATVVILMIKYIVSNTLKTTKELESYFGTEVLCLVDYSSSKKSTKFDNYIKKLRKRVPQENAFHIASTKISLLSKIMGIKDVCFVEDERISNLDNDSLAVDGVKTSSITDVKNSPDALVKMSEAAAIVLVCKLDTTKIEDVEFIVNHAIQYEVPILGTIAVL